MTSPTTGLKAAAERRTFGHLFQVGRIWYVRYRVGGKEYEESSHKPQREAAEKLLDRRAAELGAGTFVAPDVKRTRFEHLAQFIRDDYAANRRRSVERLEISLAHLALAFSGTRATAITFDRLNRYARERREAQAAPATIKNELNALRRAFKLAKRAGKVASVPDFPQLEVANVRTGFFERADFDALLLELPEPLRAPFEFAYLTGWRTKSEVLPLTWERVDFEAGVVRLDVGSTKTGQGRTFPFHVLPRLQALLEQQRATTDAVERESAAIVPWVFHRNGRPIRDYHEAWHRACRRAAVRKRGPLEEVVRPQLLGRVPHDFRRTAVRNLVRAGVPEHIAMKLTGHRTRDIFDRYDIVSERDLADGVGRLATYLEARSGGTSR
jgi:integrase